MVAKPKEMDLCFTRWPPVRAALIYLYQYLIASVPTSSCPSCRILHSLAVGSRRAPTVVNRFKPFLPELPADEASPEWCLRPREIHREVGNSLPAPKIFSRKNGTRHQCLPYLHAWLGRYLFRPKSVHRGCIGEGREEVGNRISVDHLRTEWNERVRAGGPFILQSEVFEAHIGPATSLAQLCQETSCAQPG